MTKDTIWVVLTAVLLTVTSGFLVGTRTLSIHLYLMMLLFVAVAYLLGQKTKSDRESWLPGLMAAAMIAKLVGSSLRYYVLEFIYNGSGDAGRYHGFALVIADTWRNLSVPDITAVAFGSEGTRFTAWATGLLYGPYEPSMLGGFWIHAMLAFIGQLFFYLAFRTAAPDNRWKRFAILIFFWPTLIYWPSSIGKESLILLFLGIGAWAVAHLYRNYALRWLPFIAAAAFMVSMVRVHVAAIFAVAAILAVLFENRKVRAPPPHRRILILVIGAAVALPLAFGVADQFGVDLEEVSLEDVDPVFANVQGMTGQGGSAVSGGVITSPVDIPAGVLKVLFRPLPYEARNLQMLISSLEGTALLVLMLWQTPNMVRNRRLLRQSPFLLFCIAYSAFFIWAWSAILNLGILARQRSLVFPFVFALVAALGWETQEDSKHDATSWSAPEAGQRPGRDSETIRESDARM